MRIGSDDGSVGRSMKMSSISPSSWNSGARTCTTPGRFERNETWLLNSDFKVSSISIALASLKRQRALCGLVREVLFYFSSIQVYQLDEMLDCLLVRSVLSRDLGV